MATSIPFTAASQLSDKLNDQDIRDDASQRLSNELSCAVLDELYPILDLVARKSSFHIDPIHKHLQRGRRIILTEDPGLHLVWNRATVYIKPLPPYLLSYSFWRENLVPGSPHRSSALGFVRSYERLVRYPSDFELAKEAHLIPSSSRPASSQTTQQAHNQPIEELSYAAFRTFIHCFSDIADAEVSLRWHYGQIRLSRLNWAVRIFQPRAAMQKGLLHRLFYEEQFWQTGEFLNEFAAPLLFFFAALSLILSSMQVALTAQSGGLEHSWRTFAEVSTWFSIMVIISLITVFWTLGGAIVGIWVWQFHFGYRSWVRSNTAYITTA